MFEYGDIQKLSELLNPKLDKSDSEDESDNVPGPSRIKNKREEENVVPSNKKVNPYAKIENKENTKSKRSEILELEGDEVNLEFKEEARQADWKQTPVWNIVYKQQVTASDIYLQMGLKNPTTASCEDMIITIELPGESRQNMDLKIKCDRLTLVSPRFYLNLPLPHPVDPQKGNAKFDNDAGKLIVTLRMDREFDIVNF